MLKNYCHVTFVIDRSGSMHTIAADTIGGFNKFIEDQKRVPGKATVSVYQFNHNVDTLQSFVPIEEAVKLGASNYKTSGNTSLNDAIGMAIVETGRVIDAMDESQKPEKVIVVIITDGMENSSREFSKMQVRDMVGHQETKYSWNFVFLAANQDAFLTGEGYGIPRGSTMTYMANSIGVSSSYGSLSANIGNTRKGLVATPDFTEEDRKKQEEALKPTV